jgi:hypothetical protein
MVAVLATGSAASAAPMVVTNDVTFSDAAVVCPGLGVTFDVALEGRETIQDFGDRVVSHTNLQGDVVASDGTTLRVHHAWTEELDLVNGTLTITGIPLGTRVEKTSIMRMDRGRLVLDLSSFEPIFMAGQWLPFFGPVQATCDLIAAAQA